MRMPGILKTKGGFGLFSASLIVPMLYPLFIVYTRKFLDLPKIYRYCLFSFFTLQLISAMASQNPWASVPLSTFRSVIIVSLIIFGYSSYNKLRLAMIYIPLSIIGLFSIVLSINSYGFHGIVTRKNPLEYLYISSNSISILGSLIILLIMLEPRKLRVRNGICLTIGLIMLFFGDGRVAYIGLASVVSYLFVFSKMKIGLKTFVFSYLFIVSLLLSLMDLSLRSVVWENVIRLILRHPLQGVGVFQIGGQIDHTNVCQSLSILTRIIPNCPHWLDSLGNPWVIAHNGSLHVIAESGLIGFLGWIFLWGLLIYVTSLRNVFYNSIFALLLPINLIDNSMLSLSPGYFEVLLVALGIVGNDIEQRDANTSRILRIIFLGLLSGMTFAITPFVHLSLGKTPLKSLFIISTPFILEKGIYQIYIDLYNDQDGGRVMLKGCDSVGICSPLLFKDYLSRSYRGWLKLKSKEKYDHFVLAVSYRNRPGIYNNVARWNIDSKAATIVDPQNRMRHLPCDQIETANSDDYRVKWGDGRWSSPYPFALYFKPCRDSWLAYKVKYDDIRPPPPIGITNLSTSETTMIVDSGAYSGVISVRGNDLYLIYRYAMESDSGKLNLSLDAHLENR